jgi:hypothetical protein
MPSKRPAQPRHLNVAETAVVLVDDEAITVRTPSLVGAIVAKAAADSIPATRDERLRHQQDLALLLSLATRLPVRTFAVELTKKDKSRMQTALATWIDDDLHEAWFAVDNRPATRNLAGALLNIP